MARLKKVVYDKSKQTAPTRKTTLKEAMEQMPSNILVSAGDPALLDTRDALYQQVQEYYQTEADHYGYPSEVPERLQKRMDAIKGAPTKEEAYVLLKRAQDAILTAILAAWANGKISGPTTENSVEKQIKKAESLAQMLEKKGQDENARRQWARAQKLKDQLEEIREESKA